jgi:hypothetical protein
VLQAGRPLLLECEQPFATLDEGLSSRREPADPALLDGWFEYPYTLERVRSLVERALHGSAATKLGGIRMRCGDWTPSRRGRRPRAAACCR